MAADIQERNARKAVTSSELRHCLRPWGMLHELAITPTFRAGITEIGGSLTVTNRHKPDQTLRIGSRYDGPCFPTAIGQP